MGSQQYDEILKKENQISQLIDELSKVNASIQKLNMDSFAAIEAEKEKNINLQRFLQKKVRSMMNILAADPMQIQYANRNLRNDVTSASTSCEGSDESCYDIDMEKLKPFQDRLQDLQHINKQYQCLLIRVSLSNSNPYYKLLKL